MEKLYREKYFLYKKGCWLFGENKQKGDMKCFKVGALPSQHNKAN